MGDEWTPDEVKRSVDGFFSDPAVQRGLKELAQAEQGSHLARGDALMQEGRYEEAIEEYRQNIDLEITTYALASVVERAFCHMGDAYRLLGEREHAAEAYARALDVWREYGYGEMPVASLAALYLEEGRVDEVIRLCEEHAQEAGDLCVRPILEEAQRRKAGGAPSPEPLRGCRRIHLPFRYPGALSR